MRHDLAIRGATVIDGSGARRFSADVYLTGDRISAVRPPERVESARETLEASGLVLAPGFIDVHTHDDMAVIVDPLLPAKLSQGVTTVVTGLCGYSPAPLPAGRVLPQEYDILIPPGGATFRRFRDYLAAVGAARPAVNTLALVGHSSLRLSTMDDLSRPADAAELAVMERLLAEALDDGAAGLSSGLAYAMAEASSTGELVALCRIVASRHGLYVTHVRDEGDGLVDAVAEALAIGRAAGVPVILSHHKAHGVHNHGKVAETLAMVDAASAAQAVGLDLYPYAYSSTSLTPERAARGGEVVVTRSAAMPHMAGRRLSEVAAELGCDESEAAARLQPAGALFHLMSETDVRRVLQHPRAMIGSDGLPFDQLPHPRLWGTFPRVLGHYSRDLQLLPLEEAVFRMTGLPARTFSLEGRGSIAEGAFADLVLFDAAHIGDRADATNPTATATGIHRVWINGCEPSRGTGRQLRR